jgi:hypothetical protein
MVSDALGPKIVAASEPNDPAEAIRVESSLT